MLAIKKFANKTLTLTSVGLLFLPHTATAELQNIEAKSMPTQNQTIATNNITVRKVQFLSQGTKVEFLRKSYHCLQF